MLKHIVKNNPRFKPAHYLIFFGLAIFVVVWYLYDNPRLHTIRIQLSQAHDINQLWSANLDLKNQNKSLSEKILKLERLANVDNATSIRLQNEIKLPFLSVITEPTGGFVPVLPKDLAACFKARFIKYLFFVFILFFFVDIYFVHKLHKIFFFSKISVN